MGNDQVEFFIAAVDGIGIITARKFMVEGMEDRFTFKHRVTRYTRQIVHLIHHHRIGDHRFTPESFGYGIGQRCAKIAGMFTVDT